MNQLNQATQIELLKAMLDGSKVGALVTDASKEDHPIIYANHPFETLTGYTQAEIIGKNCRFLQGKGTNPSDIERIRKAIQNEESISITIKNYRKDGSMFWNRLQIDPIRVDSKLYFIGTQTDVTIEHSQRKILSEKELEIEQLLLPILSLRDDLAAVALIGEMSHERYNQLTIKLSEFVKRERVENVIIDVTGLFWNEDGELSIGGLYRIQDVLKLMGSTLYITGITPKFAIELSLASEEKQPLLTYSSIQQALGAIQRHALATK